MCHKEGTPCAGLLGKLMGGLILAPWGGCPADPERLFWKADGQAGHWLWCLISQSRPGDLVANSAGGFCQRPEHCVGVRHPEKPALWGVPQPRGSCTPGWPSAFLPAKSVTEDSECQERVWRRPRRGPGAAPGPAPQPGSLPGHLLAPRVC